MTLSEMERLFAHTLRLCVLPYRISIRGGAFFSIKGRCIDDP